jgi:MYXO-CTERM domain-containing protein
VHKARALVFTLGLLAAGPAAHAESAVRPPVGCYAPPSTWPPAGETVPANVPAFLFIAATYNTMGPRTLDSYAIELRDGNGVLVPTAIELAGSRPFLQQASGSNEQYFVRPQRALAAGEAVLSFLDDCGTYVDAPLVPRARREVRFKVGPAVTLPTSLGTVRVTGLQQVPDSQCRNRLVDFELLLDPALAKLPLLRILMSSPEGALGGTLMRYAPGRLVGHLLGWCGPDRQPGYLGQGTTLVSIAVDFGAAMPLAPLTLSVTFDCGADAGICDLPDAGPPDALRDGPGGVMTGDTHLYEDARPWEGWDEGLPAERPGHLLPDAGNAPAPDALEPTPDAHGATPASRGCDCTTGGHARAASLPLLLVALAALLRSASRRRSFARRGRGAE